MADNVFTIDGRNIGDIPSFYDELNRVFMPDEDWQLGQSLDALDDMLYGGYGALRGRGEVTIVWTEFEKCRQALGIEATRDHFLAKLTRPDRFNAERIRNDLDSLNRGVGPTYFDIILQIFADHPNITLRAE